MRFTSLVDLELDVDAADVLTAARRVGIDFQPGTALSSGTTAYKFDIALLLNDYTITSGGSLSLNLRTSSGFQGADTDRDLLGRDIVMVECGLVMVWVRPETSASAVVLVGGEGTAAAWDGPWNTIATSVNHLQRDGIFLATNFSDPAWPVNAGDTNILKLAASGANADVSAMVLGRSA